MTEERKLTDLVSVGPATVRDLHKLGITEVDQLIKQDHVKLFKKLEKITSMRQDPCVLDVFQCAIEQARDPNLPPDECQWFYWSKVRKGEIKR